MTFRRPSLDNLVAAAATAVSNLQIYQIPTREMDAPPAALAPLAGNADCQNFW